MCKDYSAFYAPHQINNTECNPVGRTVDITEEPHAILDSYSADLIYRYDGEDICETLIDILTEEEVSQSDKILGVMSIIAGLQGFIND